MSAFLISLAPYLAILFTFIVIYTLANAYISESILFRLATGTYFSK